MYIHKQNNPILICIVHFLVGPQDLSSLCKPWDRLWTWMLGQHAGCSTTSNNSCPVSTPSCRLGLELYHDHFQVQDLLWIPRHITAQHTLIPTYTYINNNTYNFINNTLISTYTCINNNAHLYQQ